MGEECKECRSWEEEIYWTHFQSIHFSQFLRAGFERQLAIPENFVKNLRKKLPETVTLKGPGGVTWVIGITVNDDSFYFNHGWKEFVENNFLEENDILVFKYNGESHFDVLMFDGGSLCEKVGSYFVRKCGHTEHDRGSQAKRKDRESSSVEVLHSPQCGVISSPPERYTNNHIDYGLPVKRKDNEGSSVEVLLTPQCGVVGSPPERYTNNHIDSGLPAKTKDGEGSSVEVLLTPQCGFVGGPERSMNNHINTIPVGRPIIATPTTHKRTRGALSYTRPKNLMPSFRNGSESDGAEAVDVKPDPTKLYKSGPQYSSNRRPVTEIERVNALRLAQAALPDLGFLVVMKPTHVHKKFYMAIPSGWMKRHLSMQNQDVILRANEKTWHAKFYYIKKRSSGGLSLGWRNFSLDNNLDVSDVCVFEPATPASSPIVLDVSIFRVVAEVTPPTQLTRTSIKC